MKKNSLLGILVIGALTILVLFILRKDIYSHYITEEFNQEVGEFYLLNLQGDTIRPVEWENKVVVLDFWASWCSICQSAFPEFQQVYEKFESHPDVVILAVNNSRQNTIDDARTFMARNPRYTFPAAYDPDGQLARKLAGDRGIPTWCLIDRQGRMRLRHRGFRRNWEDYSGTLIDHINDYIKQ